jgi:hypothetical protein
MASILVQLTLPKRDAATLVKEVEWSMPDSIAIRISRFIDGFNTGNERPGTLTVSVPENGTAATGTLTFTSAVATNTFAVAGVTFTAVASGATNNQFNIGGSNAITAANAVTAILASTTAAVNNSVTATSNASGVVTVSSLSFDATGNFIALAGGTNIAASGAFLTGGVRDAGLKTFSK